MKAAVRSFVHTILSKSRRKWRREALAKQGEKEQVFLPEFGWNRGIYLTPKADCFRGVIFLALRKGGNYESYLF